MKRTALVFDLDGTLVDSADDLQAALNETLREIGAPPLALATVRGMIGDGAAVLVQRGLAARGIAQEMLPERLARFLAIYEAAPAVRTRPYPGVRETLAALQAKGRRLAICTNKPQAATLAVLRALELESFFAAIVGGDLLSARKPDPRHVLDAVAQLDASPAAAAMIGDSEHDVTAAKAAGLPVIFVCYGYGRVPLDQLAVDQTIDTFGDLPRALAALEA